MRPGGMLVATVFQQHDRQPYYSFLNELAAGKNAHVHVFVPVGLARRLTPRCSWLLGAARRDSSRVGCIPGSLGQLISSTCRGAGPGLLTGPGQLPAVTDLFSLNCNERFMHVPTHEILVVPCLLQFPTDGPDACCSCLLPMPVAHACCSCRLLVQRSTLAPQAQDQPPSSSSRRHRRTTPAGLLTQRRCCQR